MNSDFNIFVVDDDPVTQDILRSIIEPHYPAEVFASAEDCRRRISQRRPDCILLDIGLPGMSGYQFCQLLKDDPDTRGIPVTFISGHDNIDDRLRGYDAGGEDFIAKPLEPAELLRKIKVAEQFQAAAQRLQEDVRNANALSTMAMASLGDSSMLLQFAGRLIGAADERQVAAETLGLLQQMAVDGAIQARVGERAYTLSGAGENLPLEVSVLDHVRTLDRIFEFHRRAVWNHDRVTVMIRNMPEEDPVLCGRIRDNLAIAAQAAAARLEAIDTEERGRRSQAGIAHALTTLERALDHLDESHRQSRYEISQLVYQLTENLGRSFVALGLSDAQEQHLDALIEGFLRRLGQQLDQDNGFVDSLRALSADLRRFRT